MLWILRLGGLNLFICWWWLMVGSITWWQHVWEGAHDETGSQRRIQGSVSLLYDSQRNYQGPRRTTLTLLRQCPNELTTSLWVPPLKGPNTSALPTKKQASNTWTFGDKSRANFWVKPELPALFLLCCPLKHLSPFNMWCILLWNICLLSLSSQLEYMLQEGRVMVVIGVHGSMCSSKNSAWLLTVTHSFFIEWTN